MDKKIVAIITIAVAIVFSSLIIGLYSSIETAGNNVDTGLGTELNSLSQSTLDFYDDNYVSGKQVKWAIDNMTIVNGKQMILEVATLDGESDYNGVYKFGYDTTASPLPASGIANKTIMWKDYASEEDLYNIRDSAIFKSELIVEEVGTSYSLLGNRGVIGIKFTQQPDK